MRQTQPLNADELAIELALRKKRLSHAEIDRALTKHRLCVYAKGKAGDPVTFFPRYVYLGKRK